MEQGEQKIGTRRALRAARMAEQAQSNGHGLAGLNVVVNPETGGQQGVLALHQGRAGLVTQGQAVGVAAQGQVVGVAAQGQVVGQLGNTGGQPGRLAGPIMTWNQLDFNQVTAIVGAADTTAATRHGRLPRRRPFKTLSKVVASIAAVVFVSGGAVAAYAAADLAASARPAVHLSNEKKIASVPDVAAIEGGVNMLLIGSDSRQGQGLAFGDPSEEEGVLNDVTMLLHISQDHTHAEVISFPRDMYVSVPKCDDPKSPGDTLSSAYSVKLNSVLDRGGMDCVVRTIEQLTGVTIPFAGVVQFMGVAALSDAIGGVDVCVADPIEDKYTGTFLDAGMHTLQGVPALQFLRTRHGVGDGSDLGRISNQQVFLSALARKLQSGNTLSDPVKLYAIAKAALENMTLSASLAEPTRMVSIAKAMKDIDLSKLAFIQYPTGTSADGLRADSSAKIVNAALQADRPIVFDPDNETGSDIGSVDPTKPTAGPKSTTSPTATPSPSTLDAEPSPTDLADPYTTASSTPDATAEAKLPDNVLGQTAAQTRCSKGRTLDDQ